MWLQTTLHYTFIKIKFCLCLTSLMLLLFLLILSVNPSEKYVLLRENNGCRSVLCYLSGTINENEWKSFRGWVSIIKRMPASGLSAPWRPTSISYFHYCINLFPRCKVHLKLVEELTLDILRQIHRTFRETEFLSQKISYLFIKLCRN